MRWFRVLLVSLALGAVLFGSSAEGQAEPPPNPSARARFRRVGEANTCVTCHLTLPDKRLRTVAERFQTSVHRDERIGCVGCHRGNPRDPTVQAHDLASGFVVRPAPGEIAALCGGCHEDPTFIRQFNARLPTDQRKLYALSAHGKLAAEANPAAPTCVDCHGSHEIMPVNSPAARVHPGRVVELCETCHANPAHMRPFGIGTEQVAQWRKSVHGRAFQSGNRAAPTCTGCHSPHTGALGGVSVAAACGRCHEDERELFLASPHARPFRRLGLAECVPCHGDHEVEKSSWLSGMSPESACSRCHARDVKVRRVADRIETVMTSLNERQDAVRSRLERAEAVGLHAPEAVLAMAQLKSGRLALAASLHDLDVDHLGAQAVELGRLADQAENDVRSVERGRRVERRGYYAALAVSVLLFGLLVRKSMKLAQTRSRKP